MRSGWQMVAPGRMEPVSAPLPEIPEDHVVVRVVGCGVCHTDLGFFYDGVRTRHPLPLTLGHEISGFVLDGRGLGAALKGQAVIVPAVIPCGTCALCKAGLGTVCPKQVFPGNDVDGGFASHVVVPARGLCVVPECLDDELGLGVSGVTLRELAVIADAVSTPYQAARRAGVQRGDVAVVVGCGGVGGYAVQIARAMGAHVVAIDVKPEKLEAAAKQGADAVFSAATPDLKKVVRAHARAQGWRDTAWKIFETSGSPRGQATAFDLLGPAATLMVVGFTREPVELRFSNLMAFDATARGSWGCLPEYYPEVLQLVLDGKVDVSSWTETRELDQLPQVFESLHSGGAHARRVVLVPSESL